MAYGLKASSCHPLIGIQQWIGILQKMICKETQQKLKGALDKCDIYFYIYIYLI